MSEKILKLLDELKIISEKLNKINEEINDTGTDGEDMIPGHDDGAEWWAKMTKYKVYMDQARSIKKQLNDLGYNKI